MSVLQDTLIDNATLSGVQRLLGGTQTLNLANVENDICCFERLIGAILFGGKLYALNDYKREYQEGRRRVFPYISFIDKTDIPYNQLAEESAAFARSCVFAFEGSKPVGEALAFFEAIKVVPQMRWSIFTSSEYLTLSYLVKDKNSTYEPAVSAAFGNELYDKDKSDGQRAAPALAIIADGKQNPIDDVKSLVNEYSRCNPNFSGMGSKDTLEKVIFGYGWVAERSFFYHAVAARLGVSCILSPLRDAFSEATYRLDHANELDVIIAKISEAGQATVAKIVRGTGEAKFALKLPFFTAFLLSRCENVGEALDLAFELREQKDIADCRGLLSNLQHLERKELIKEVNIILGHLEQRAQALLKEYGVDLGQGPAVGVSLGLTGPSIEASTHLGRLFAAHRNRPFGKVLRSMSRDMMNVERLGALYDKATAQIREHKDARHSRPAMVPEFMERKSNEYGRPALPVDH